MELSLCNQCSFRSTECFLFLIHYIMTTYINRYIVAYIPLYLFIHYFLFLPSSESNDAINISIIFSRELACHALGKLSSICSVLYAGSGPIIIFEYDSFLNKKWNLVTSFQNHSDSLDRLDSDSSEFHIVIAHNGLWGAYKEYN